MKKFIIGSVLSSAILTSAIAAVPEFTLNFDDNQLPSGWSIQSTSVNSNYGFADGRFYAGEVDSAAYIQRPYSNVGNATALVFEWDGSVFLTYWGNFASVRLNDTSGKQYFASIGSASASWGTNTHIVVSDGAQVYAENLALPSGTYRFKAQFSDGEVSFAGSLDGNEMFWQVLPSTAIDITKIESIQLFVYETLGPDMWIDNVSMTPVPEVQSSWLLLAGLASLGVLLTQPRTGPFLRQSRADGA